MSALWELFLSFRQGNVRQNVSNPSPSLTAPRPVQGNLAPRPVQGNLVLSKAKLLCSPTPATSACGHSGSTGSPVPVCQTLPPSFLDAPGSVGLGSFMKSLYIGDSFAPSAPTSVLVITYFSGLAPHSFGDQVTCGWGGGWFLPLALVLMLGWIWLIPWGLCSPPTLASWV